MKNKIILYIIVAFLPACTKEEPAVYAGKPLAEFYNAYGTNIAYTTYANFYYSAEGVQKDTIYLPLRIRGAIPTVNSFIKLEDYNDSTVAGSYVRAKAGVHFVAFDDPAVKNIMQVKAGVYEDSIPVILLRDTSLKSNSYRLSIKIGSSDDVLAGSRQNSYALIYISDGLSIPSNWSSVSSKLGTYGKVKHAFMIRVTGDKWDADFLTTLINDSGLLTYYAYKVKQALADENAVRALNGQDPLRENPLDATTNVVFP